MIKRLRTQGSLHSIFSCRKFEELIPYNAELERLEKEVLLICLACFKVFYNQLLLWLENHLFRSQQKNMFKNTGLWKFFLRYCKESKTKKKVMPLTQA